MGDIYESPEEIIGKRCRSTSVLVMLWDFLLGIG